MQYQYSTSYLVVVEESNSASERPVDLVVFLVHQRNGFVSELSLVCLVRFRVLFFGAVQHVAVNVDAIGRPVVGNFEELNVTFGCFLDNPAKNMNVH